MSATVLKQFMSSNRNGEENTRMPVLFLGHGSPMNAIANNAFTNALTKLGETLPRPKAILMISAHWITQGTRVERVALPETIHDFGGFPNELFQIQYPAPGAIEVADQVAALTSPKGEKIASIATDWGLDHGTWSVLRHVYPKADIPVLQLSLSTSLDLKEHMELAKSLRSLRDQGVMIMGSGNITHNLRRIDWDENAKPLDWTVEFDELIKSSLLKRDLSELLAKKPEKHALWKLAHPSIDHYVPLLYALGASEESDMITFPYEGIQNGSLSMRAVQFG